MTLKRIYIALWSAYLALAGIFMLTGNMTQFVGVVFGFFAMPLIFMGMIIVLPFSLSHPDTPKAEKPKRDVAGSVKDFVKTQARSWSEIDMSARSMKERRP